jgi:hypothetical protein
MRGKGILKLNLRPGINFSRLDAISPNGVYEFNFDSNASFRIGTELEYVSRINNYKWSIFIEPTFQQYQSDYEINLRPNSNFPDVRKVTVDYSSIELPIGLRHYLFLNDNSKLFLDAGFMLDFVLKSDTEIENNDQTDFVLESKGNLFFGFGYKFQDKYSVSFRLHTPRSTTGESGSWNSKYYTTSVIFGYSIF